MQSKEKIKSFILTFLRSNGQPRKRRDLLIFLKVSGFVLSDSEMRRIIQEMIELDGKLIGSTHNAPAGYFLIRNMAEAETAAAERKAKALTELRIANRLMAGAALLFGKKEATLFDIVENKEAI